MVVSVFVWLSGKRWRRERAINSDREWDMQREMERERYEINRDMYIERAHARTTEGDNHRGMDEAEFTNGAP